MHTRTDVPMVGPGTAFVVMVRAPRPGDVKTRLAAGVGPELALEVFRELAALTMTAVKAAVAGLRQARVVVYFTPEDGGDEIGAWLGAGLETKPQCSGPLGERMLAAIMQECAAGADTVVVLGTDCPHLAPVLLRDAVNRLHDFDVVLGPAEDGGYYLIAMRVPQAALFRDVPWSSPETLKRTLDIADSLGLRTSLLPMLADVDTAADLARWRNSQRAQITAADMRNAHQ